MGGWRWTSHSPTGSDPEGSSPNERGSGRSSASHPLFRSAATAPSLSGRKRSRAGRMHLERQDRPTTGSLVHRLQAMLLSWEPLRFACGARSEGRAEPGAFLESNSPAKQTMSDTTTPSYRVLARKYRPATFDDLIGQDAMVRTISNAFEAGRIPQAWILT